MSEWLLVTLCILAALLALVPALLFARNWRLYRAPPLPAAAAMPAMSVLIPARNEEAGIGDAVASVLAIRDVELELIVLDDNSEDQTADVVRRVARHDPRLRLERGLPLPQGWCGKQHACWQLSRLARHPLLVFLDADVRLAPEALSRLAAFLQHSQADLISGIPRQQTHATMEKLLIPLIHFVLLGYLPMDRMRASSHPSYGAGCGQLFMACRDAYEQSGGHAAIRLSRHDGITLPRAFRQAGFRTDLCDVTGLATCRMYDGNATVWQGLAKNATEGMASPVSIVPWTLLLLLGQVLPMVLLVVLILSGVHSAGEQVALIASAVAAMAVVSVRSAVAWRFRQSWLSALLHPLGILLLLAIQWYALIRHLLGRPASWKGRSYEAGSGSLAPESA